MRNKTATVPKDKKNFRRAMELLAGDTLFHGAGNNTAKNIVAAKAIHPSLSSASMQRPEVYFGTPLPADPWAARDNTVFAFPRSTIKHRITDRSGTAPPHSALPITLYAAAAEEVPLSGGTALVPARGGWPSRQRHQDAIAGARQAGLRVIPREVFDDAQSSMGGTDLARLQSGLGAKIAEVSTELKPHQQRVIDRIKQQPGLVVAHGMGSGKTLTSIAAAEAMGGPTTVLAPAALQSNYRKEIAKHITGTPNAQFDIGSLQRAALHGEIAPAKTLIVDEAHRLRDPGSMARKAVRDADVEKRLLLTGTALYNRPYDLASLVNVAAGDNVFPGTQGDFDKQYIGEKVTDPGWFAKTFRGVKPGSTPTLKNEKQLGDILQKWVDYHENNTEGFPTRHDETVNVDMSPKQQELYDFSMGKAPAWVKYKIQHGLPPSKAESKDLNAFSGAVRQVSVSPGGFSKEMSPEEAASYSPKIQEAYKRLAAGIAANPQHRAVVYSNFLDSGLSPYESLLKQHNVPYGKFTGDVKPADRDKMVADYNSGALKALLLSSAGGEGLDLKGTRQIQVLEPHWNKEKLEQVIARGIRYKSHEALPEDQRSVNVEHYMSQMPEPGALRKLLGAKRPGAIDSYLEMMSKDKDNLNQQVRELLKKTDQAPAKTASLGGVLSAHADRVSSM